MLSRCSRSTLSLCLLAFVFLAHAEQVSAMPAQDGKTLESTARQRQYLDRRPYHTDVFDDLCERAMGQGGLAPLLEHYRTRRAQDATDRAARVLLTRLLLRSGELQAAREVGRELAGDGVAGRLLIGDLELRLGQVERAAELFEAALQASPRLDDRRRVLRRLCELALDSGDEQQLLKRAESLGALDPADYPLQVEAAELLLQGGLLQAAAQAYGVALALVPDDVPRRTQTLADLGACHQRLFEGDQALAYYREALGLLRGDHWLAQELAARRLVLHTIAGTLGQLAQALKDEAAQPNSGAGPLLTLARLEETRGRLPQALEALLRARERAPRDERVSELLIGAAERTGKPLQVQAELERRLGLEPASPGLLLRLADSLRRAGESAGARTRLVQASRLAQGQAAWAPQLARAWVRLEDPQRAAQVLDSALAQEPSPTLVLERARLAAETGSADGKVEALAILVRGKPEEAVFMLAFAELHGDLGDLGGAQALLERAAQLDANSPTPLLAHAELLIAADRIGSARPLLRAAAARARGDARLEILRQLQRLFGSHEELRAWCEQEARLWEGDTDEPLPLLIQARLLESSSPAEATQLYVAFLREAEQDLEVTRSLAALLARRRKYDEALSVLERMATFGRAARQEAAFERVSLLSRLRRNTEAIEVLEELSKLGWKQPDVLRRVARWHGVLRQPEAAIAALDRVLRLDPDDVTSARSLGNLLLQVDQSERARVQLERAWRAAPGADRMSIAEELFATLGDAEQTDRALLDMVGRARKRIYDRGLSLLSSQLALRAKRPELSWELATEQLRRRPRDLEFLHVKARADLRLGHVEAALKTVRLLVELGADADELVFELVPEVQASGGSAGVWDLGALTLNAAAVGGRLVSQGHRQRALDLMQGAVQKRGLESQPELVRLLSKMHRYLDNPEFGIAVFERLEALDGPTVVSTHRLGLFFARAGGLQEALACAERLQRLGAAQSLIDSFLTTTQLQEAWLKR